MSYVGGLDYKFQVLDTVIRLVCSTIIGITNTFVVNHFPRFQATTQMPSHNQTVFWYTTRFSAPCGHRIHRVIREQTHNDIATRLDYATTRPIIALASSQLETTHARSTLVTPLGNDAVANSCQRYPTDSSAVPASNGGEQASASFLYLFRRSCLRYLQLLFPLLSIQFRLP